MIQEEPADSGAPVPTPTGALLAELSPNTDLAWLVERVSRTQLTWVVVPASALTAWKQRDPAGWAKVSAWLTLRGVKIVHI